MSAEFQLRHVGQKPSLPDIKDFVEITSDITLIGRNKIAADLFLDSSTKTGLISRMHARIIRTSKGNEHQYELCDTSLNGTYVNDYKIFGSVKLHDGDVIGFGHTRGAVLQSGDYAPQNDSEFLFKFERISKDPKQIEKPERIEQPVSFNEASKNQKLIVPSGVPSVAEDADKKTSDLNTSKNDSIPFSNGENSASVKISPFQRLKLLTTVENTPSDEDLRSLVPKVSSFVEDSDEDLSLFPVPMQALSPEYNSPGPRKTLIENQDRLQINEETPVASIKLKGAQKRKKSLEKENCKKTLSNRRNRAGRSTEPQFDRKPRYSHELCAAIDCAHPRDVKNTWVQCDDCDQWFHLKCAGLTAKDAKKKNTAYHCGGCY